MGRQAQGAPAVASLSTYPTPLHPNREEVSSPSPGFRSTPARVQVQSPSDLEAGDASLSR